LAVSGAEAADHDKFFWGTTGKRLKQLVANAAAQTGLNPGLLAAIIMAETRNPETYLTSGPVNSYLIGTDDFYEARAAIAARVPAYSKVNWDKNQTPYEHYNDAKTNPRKVKSIDFDSGGDALLATGVYAKFYEVRMREIARSLKGDFDNLPIETRFALTRMAMAAGAAGATPFLKDALAGKDIFVRKPIPVAIYQTQRNASVRTAQALHLSEWIFGIPLATSTQSHEMESEFSHSIAVSNENQESAEGGAVVFERQTPKLIHPAYNHAAAVEYAKQFAFRPCSDGFMLLKDGKYTRVKGDEKISNGGVQQLLNADGSTFTLPDGTAVSQIEMDDCTHFISCCVGQPPGGGGGGIRIPDMWGSHGPYGITRVSISTKDGNRDPDLKLGMIEYLTDHKFARIVAAKTHDESEIKKLEAGDLIAYFDSAEGYRHLALYLGDGKIAAHTISRLGDDWRAPGSGRWRYTLIHFV
jgi:hypothetical protein